MKLAEIKPVRVNVVESLSTDPVIMLESAADMVRTIRTKISANQDTSTIDDFWTTENVVRFCAGLDRIERVVEPKVKGKVFDQNLRDATFSVLTTAGFDKSTLVQKIVAQSNSELIAKWKKILDEKKNIAAELDVLARNISSLVSQLRAKGAMDIIKKLPAIDNGPVKI